VSRTDFLDCTNAKFRNVKLSEEGGKESQINIYFRKLQSLSTAQSVLQILRFLHKTYDVFVLKKLFVLGRLRMLIFYHSL
jgi:hypothetical protein